MRRFLVIAIAILLAGVAMGQQKVVEQQLTTVTAAGCFTNGGLLDTTLRVWGPATSQGGTGLSTYPSFSTRLDSVVHTAAANDSVWERLPQYAHSVSFEIQAKQVGAVRCDSTKFFIYGSKSNTYWTGALVLLTSFTMANSSAAQVFTYDVNSGNGNPYTGYRVSAVNGNLSAGSQAQWQAFMLVR